MSYRTGIVAAQDGKTVDDSPQAYRSDYGHLLVDTRPEVGHLGIYEGTCGAAVLTVNDGEIKEQIFASYKHELPFIPRATAYMLIRDAPASVAFLVGRYAGGFFGLFGFPVTETVFLRVNETHIHFIHKVSHAKIGGSPPAYNSIMQASKIRAKFIINSNEGPGMPYDTDNPWL